MQRVQSHKSFFERWILFLKNRLTSDVAEPTCVITKPYSSDVQRDLMVELQSDNVRNWLIALEVDDILNSSHGYCFPSSTFISSLTHRIV